MKRQADFVPRKAKKKFFISSVSFASAREQKAAIEDSKAAYGNYGFSLFVRDLIKKNRKK